MNERRAADARAVRQGRRRRESRCRMDPTPGAIPVVQEVGFRRHDGQLLRPVPIRRSAPSRSMSAATSSGCLGRNASGYCNAEARRDIRGRRARSSTRPSGSSSITRSQQDHGRRTSRICGCGTATIRSPSMRSSPACRRIRPRTGLRPGRLDEVRRFAITWSILARDPVTGALGAAVSTRSLAAGGLCLFGSGRVGVLSTQARFNPLYGEDGLQAFDSRRIGLRHRFGAG